MSTSNAGYLTYDQIQEAISGGADPSWFQPVGPGRGKAHAWYGKGENNSWLNPSTGAVATPDELKKIYYASLNPTGLANIENKNAADPFVDWENQPTARFTNRVLPTDPIFSNRTDNLSLLLGNLVGYDPATGQFNTTSESSLLSGPQQGYSESMLQRLYAQGKGNLQRQQQAFMGGVANAAGARGISQPSLGSYLGGFLNANTRSELAKGRLAAEQEGLNYGQQSYSNKLNLFNTLGGLANNQVAREYQMYSQGKSEAFTQMQQAEKAMQDFILAYGTQMAQKPKPGSEGDKIRDKYKALYKNLLDKYNAARDDYWSYQGVGVLNPTQTA